ncbi:ribosome silencing factor [Maledivibacter halophilus]|uniref:Ribosomal silencing factor RsfS n=1 Tax=Maledivibacter halophilus TaxID=36842 RepID=A0A1T5KLT3_9FIRM|nr:ribosome silencing factor [Maledivibacter halophilus]SKC64704.1 ribosome-associated protein [Maledivibacter halophilus]
MVEMGSDLALKVCRIIDNKKGNDIVLLDVRKLATFAEYFVIATGNSTKHTAALADEIEKTLSKDGIFINHKEGHDEGNWILLDYLDIIIHIFTKDERSFYDIERIWKGAKYVELDIDIDE